MERITDQYRIITSRAGWADRSSRGRLRFSGADALSFLQGLLTNDVSALRRGHGVYAAWLTPLGRMSADLAVLHRGDELLALVGDGMGANLAGKLDLLIFAEQVEVVDVTAGWVDVLVTGAAAVDVVSEATGAAPQDLRNLRELDQVDIAGGFVVRIGESALPAFRVLVQAKQRDRLVAALGRAGAVAMAEELATALRIEAGRGEWGSDLNDDVIPLEAGLLDRAVSTSKGCYVGQEIIIRILHRGGGRVARRLVTLEFDPSVETVPAGRTPLDVDGRTVGHVTSAAWSPLRDRVVALGYLQRDAAEAGRRVSAAGAAATVTGFAT